MESSDGERERTVYRVRNTWWSRAHLAGFVVGALAGLLFGRGIGPSPHLVVLAMALAGGFLAGAFIPARRDRCSGCAAVLAAEARVCPTCGGAIRG